MREHATLDNRSSSRAILDQDLTLLRRKVQSLAEREPSSQLERMKHRVGLIEAGETAYTLRRAMSHRGTHTEGREQVLRIIEDSIAELCSIPCEA